MRGYVTVIADSGAVCSTPSEDKGFFTGRCITGYTPACPMNGSPSVSTPRALVDDTEARDDRVQRVIPGAEPFLFSANGARVGCLLVHGFTSTPYDVRALGIYLAERGITAKGVLLAGHGTTPAELAATRLPDWLNSIRAAHAELRQQCPVVFALGISLAGNFLVTLAQELPSQGLILIGMPLRIRRERSYRALYYTMRAVGKQYQRKWYQRSLDADIRRERPNYPAIPLVCLRDAARAIEMSRHLLPTVRCPVLAIQSTTDHAIDKESMDELENGVGSADVSVEWVPDRYHVVLIDHGKEKVFERIHGFITTHLPAHTRIRKNL